MQGVPCGYDLSEAVRLSRFANELRDVVPLSIANQLIFNALRNVSHFHSCYCSKIGITPVEYLTRKSVPGSKWEFCCMYCGALKLLKRLQDTGTCRHYYFKHLVSNSILICRECVHNCASALSSEWGSMYCHACGFVAFSDLYKRGDATGLDFRITKK